MNRIRHALFLAAAPALFLIACAGDAPVRPEPESMPNSEPVPPIAAVRPHVVASPNGNRTDEYYWLRDDTRSSPEVIGYLEAENAYKAAMTAHTQALEDKVYAEIVARIKQDDSTVPYRLRQSIEQDVLDAAGERNAQLVVVGSGRKRFLESVILGSVAEGILRDAECDVLVIPGAATER